MRSGSALVLLALVCSAVVSHGQFRPIEAPAAQPLDTLPASTQPLPELQAHVTTEREGLRLAVADQMSVAGKLGLMRGDLITHVNGWPVRSVEAFAACLNTSPNVIHYLSGRTGADGKFFVAELWRDGKRFYARGALVVFLSPDALPLLSAQYMGKTLLLPELGMETRIEREGLRVTRVDVWGLGQRIGLAADDVITSVNGRPIFTHSGFREAVFDTPDAISYVAGVRPGRGGQAFRAALRRGEDGLHVHQPVSFVGAATVETANAAVSLFGGEATVSAEGLKVTRADPHSVAGQLGLKVEDVIRTINGRLITSAEELREALKANADSQFYYLSGLRRGSWYEEATQPFRAVVRRDGNGWSAAQAVQTFTRPVAESNLIGSPNLVLRELGVEAADAPQGVRITRVEPQSIAARLGLETGDILQKVNGKTLDRATTLRDALFQEQMPMYYVAGLRPARGDQAFLTVLRRNQGQFEPAQEIQWFTRPGLDPFQPAAATGKRFEISYFAAEALTDKEGIRLASVGPMGLAQKLGMQPEDVINTVNGRPVYTEPDLPAALLGATGELCYIAGTRQGRPFTASLRKQDNAVSVHERVELMEAFTHTGLRPSNTLGQQVNLVELGAWAQVERDGLRLSRVEDGTVGATIGLRSGDLIKTVNGRPVFAAREFSEAVFESPSDTVFVEGQRAVPYAQPFLVLLRRDRGGVAVAKPPDWDAHAKYRQLVTQARAAENLRNLEEAIRLYRQALDLWPNQAEADEGWKRARYLQAMDRGEQALLARQYREAAAYFEDALQARPNDLRATELLRRARGGSF